MTYNRQLVTEIFERANFIRSLGIELADCGKGSCLTRLTMQPHLQQQHGFLHAAVLCAMADHTAGGAAASMVESGQDVITVEFKISFLRPGVGPIFECTAQVLRAGKDLIFAVAEVVGRPSLEAESRHIAKLSSTLKIIPHG